MISIIVPTYNEQEVLNEFYLRTHAVLAKSNEDYELVFINDGSTDDTLSILQQLQLKDNQIVIIDLSRNFGKEVAMTAGLENAVGDAVIIIDADLQDPPELIPDMIRYWKEGYDNVYATRAIREGESVIKKVTAHLFYRAINHLSDIDIPEDTGDYRLLSRRAVDAINQVQERNRFMKGIFAWIGFPQKSILYSRDPRLAGNTKWNYWNLWNFALEGITSFSNIPLKLASYLGFFSALSAFFYGIYILLLTLISGADVPGYPSLIVIILFLGGIQLVFIGVIGEYLGRNYSESKQRPLYFVNKIIKSENHSPPG